MIILLNPNPNLRDQKQILLQNCDWIELEAIRLRVSQMEPKLLLCAHKPLLVSCNSPFNEKPYLFVKSRLPMSTIRAARSQFLGEGLILGNKYGFWSASTKTRVVVEPVRAAVKRRKELTFDNVVQRDKKLKLVLNIRKILVSQPDRTMSLKGLGRYRRDLGLKKRRRFIALLRKYPGVFEIVEEGAYSLRFKMTSEAERLYLEELRIRNGLEDLLVVKLRKLVMMSIDKRILLEKISHLRTDLGLPLEFRDTICQRYPQYFRVVPTPRGPALELTHWDPELAVSASELSEEDNKARESEERNLIIDRPPKFNRVKLPRGLNLSKSETRKIGQFRDMPYISPYKDFSHLRSGTLEKEKHACGVIHELLSLTTEKRTLVDHLTHFREEFRFSQQLRGMLIRHPDLFYVSLKGERDSVFLREAYRNSELIDKDPLTLVKEKMRALVSVPRFPRRGGPKKDEEGREEQIDRSDAEGEEEEESDDEEWSDVDGYLEGEDGGNYDEGDWSDEEGEEDVPPNFDDDEDEDEDESSVKIGLSPSSRKSSSPRKKEEKVLTPVFPDGTPREKW